METKTPFDYGYIFVDRVKNIVFFLNNFDSATYFSNYKFQEKEYKQLKKQNFIVPITKNKKTTNFDVRFEEIHGHFTEYRKLFSALPYLEKAISIDKEIENLSSVESIIDELIHLRNKRNSVDFVNDLILTEFKDWTFIEDNACKKSYELLFKHMKQENLLSHTETQIWEKEIEEID